MLVSLKWLSEYVPLTPPVRELAEKLTICGVKVERIISQGDEWDGVTVAHVLKVEPHPNADPDTGSDPNPVFADAGAMVRSAALYPDVRAGDAGSGSGNLSVAMVN